LKRRLGKGLDSLISAGPASADEGGAQQIELKRIELNPKQPRQHVDPEALKGLADSVRSAGIIQPILVRAKGEDMFELVAGERRLRAAHLAELETIPAVVREVSDDEMLELALIENVQREDLNAIDKARAMNRMTEELQLTQEQTGAKLGMDRSTVANFVRLLELSDEIQQMVSRGTLSAGHARALLGLENPAERCQLAQMVAKEGLSVRETERLAARGLSRRPKARRKESPQIRFLEQRLREALGTRIELRCRGKKGRIIVHFDDDEQFDRLFEIMTGSQRERQQPAA